MFVIGLRRDYSKVTNAQKLQPNRHNVSSFLEMKTGNWKIDVILGHTPSTYILYYCINDTAILSIMYWQIGFSTLAYFSILAYWLMLSVLNTTLNKDYSILFYSILYECILTAFHCDVLEKYIQRKLQCITKQCFILFKIHLLPPSPRVITMVHIS